MVFNEVVIVSELIINDHTSLDRKLFDMWQAQHKDGQKTIGWTEYIETLGEGIIRCTRLRGRMTSIEFETEAHKTWFVLRWG